MEQTDIIDKLGALEDHLGYKLTMNLSSDGSGVIVRDEFPFPTEFCFDSLQDFREQSYRVRFNQLNE